MFDLKNRDLCAYVHLLLCERVSEKTDPITISFAEEFIDFIFERFRKRGIEFYTEDKDISLMLGILD